MKENPDLRHRRSLRLKDYDYSQAGMYFITIGTQNYQWLFGEIREATMHLSAAGKMIEKWYWELSNKFPIFNAMNTSLCPTISTLLFIKSIQPPCGQI
jgi:putative transposase